MDLPPGQAVRPIDPADSAIEVFCACCKRMKPQEDMLDGVCSRCEANELAPKDTGSIPREWHSILYELLTYAYDNDRGSAFDYDLWDQCVQLVFTHKRKNWSMDGVRQQELLERIKAYVAEPEPEDPAAGRCRGCDLFVRRRPDGKLHCVTCDPPESEPSTYCPHGILRIPVPGREQIRCKLCEAGIGGRMKAHCKACGTEIYIGNCCGETCTRIWMATTKPCPTWMGTKRCVLPVDHDGLHDNGDEV